MSHQTKKMGLVTVILFVLSLVVHYNQNKRGTDLVAGSYFLTGFDVEKLAKFELKANGETITFFRQGENFVLESHGSYPASNEKVNEILFKVANTQISDLVTTNEKYHKEHQVASEGAGVHLIFYDKNDNKTQELFIGKTQGKGTL